MEAMECGGSVEENNNKKLVDEKSWDDFLKETEDKSFNLDLPLDKYYYAWSKLLESVHLKENAGEMIAYCLTKMIENVPVGTLNENETWTRLIEDIYSWISDKRLPEGSASGLFDFAEKKLAISYTKPPTFWKIIRQIHEKNVDKGESLKKCLETFKKQFSLPYISMKSDHKAFIKYAQSNNVSEEDRKAVNAIYEINANEAKNITLHYKNCFVDNYEEYHHLHFETWIENLSKNPQNLDRAIALCEEAILDERKSICYYFILAKVLMKSNISQSLERQQLLYKTIKRAIRHATIGCDYTIFYFLNYAFLAGTSYFRPEMCQELIRDVMNHFPLELPTPKAIATQLDAKTTIYNYFDSRKAILLCLKALVDNEKIPKTHLPMFIENILKPVSDEGFIEDLKPEYIESVPDFELRCVKLKKLSLLCEHQLTGKPWMEIFEKLWRVFCSTTNPDVVLAYTNFVREHGTASDAEIAYKKSMEYASKLNESKASYGTRRLILVLMDRLRELLAYHDGKTETLQLIEDMSKRHYLSTSQHKEAYALDITIDIPMAERQILYVNDHGEFSYSPNELHEVPTDRMNKMNVNEVEDTKAGYPVFLSNLKFNAKKRDIIKAFQHKGLEVKRVIMKVKPTGANYGFATVEFTSEKDANQALENFDHIKILDRETFVSKHEDKSKFCRPITSKPRATVLFVSDLPEEWREAKKIENALLPYGHIKTVEVDNETSSAKVEYHMEEDAYVGQSKLKDIFKGLNVSIRTGFPSQIPNFPKEKVVKKKPTIETKPKDKPTIETKPKIFVPQQLRRQMKKKLDVKSSGTSDSAESKKLGKKLDVKSSGTSDSAESKKLGTDSEECGPSKEKKMKTDSGEEKKMSNSDFRKMFL